MKGSALKNTSATDWERIDKLTDEEIDTSDIPPLDDEFFARAQLRMPDKSTVTLTVDTDVLEWFKAQGDQFQNRINAALRIYAEAHKRPA
jgi:uncharacterized protein (DUF4415 family)